MAPAVINAKSSSTSSTDLNANWICHFTVKGSKMQLLLKFKNMKSSTFLMFFRRLGQVH